MAFTVKKFVEKPYVEETASKMQLYFGRYIINSKIFDILSNTKPGKSGEIQLTDALKELVLKEDIYAYDFVWKIYDIGNKQEFLEATVENVLKKRSFRR